MYSTVHVLVSVYHSILIFNAMGYHPYAMVMYEKRVNKTSFDYDRLGCDTLLRHSLTCPCKTPLRHAFAMRLCNTRLDTYLRDHGDQQGRDQ